MPLACPFCTLPENQIIASNEHAVVIADGYPVSRGHALLIPHRHVGSFFDISSEEQGGLLALLEQAKLVLDSKYHPDGYNIGINDGLPAGQTVPHLHIHLIPRYTGDQFDPRGGIRWIFPDKAKYW